jgi:trehalose 6-phosphate phosphatase
MVAEEFLPHLANVRDEIAGKLKGMNGSLVEDNKFTVSVHYRNVKDDSQRGQLHSIVRDAMKPFEKDGLLRLTQGKEVHEIRANFDWHKGAAVNYLMQLMCSTLATKDTREIVPVYVGDDTTDEDAFY